MTPRTIEEDFGRYRQTGDTRALARVFDRVASDLFVLARHVAPRGTEAEDLVQATFVTAMEAGSAFEAGRPLLPWLAGILANHARKAVRGRSSAAAAEPRADTETDPRRRAEAVELQESLRRSLDRLAEPYRPVLSLYLLHGFSPVEIARTLGRSRATVRSQLHRGLEALRRTLPAGLAGAAALASVTGRGLAAVRGAVLREAGRAAAAGTTTFFGTAGVLMSAKKIAGLSAVALVSVLVLVRSWPAPPPAASEPPVLEAPAPWNAASTDRGEPAVRTPLRAESVRPAAPASAVQGTGALAVRLLREDERAPVPGRWITLIRPDGPDAIRYFAEARQRTGEDGQARFASLAPGRYEIRAWLVPERPLVQIEAGVGVEETLTVPAGVAVDGRVVDGAGHPVPGACIYLDTGWTRHDLPVATADGEGRFAIADVAPGYRLGAMADGFAPSHHHSVQADASMRETITIVMRRPAATLQGVVLDPDGRPIPRAFVAIQPEDLGESYRDEAGRSWRPAQIQVLLADDHGAFACRQVPAERILVAGGATEHAEFLPARASLHPTPGSSHYLELSTERGGELHGTVSRTGQAIAHLEVHAIPADRGPDWTARYLVSQFDPRSAFTDERGAYRMLGLRPGAYRLFAEGMDRNARCDVTVVAGPTQRQDLQLQPRAPLLLRVTDAAGKPMPDWRVTVHYRSTWPSEITGAEGEVRFSDFDVGKYTVLIEAPSDRAHSHHVYAALGVQDLEAGGETHTVAVPWNKLPTARIRARILDTEGRVPAAALLDVNARVLGLPQLGSAAADAAGYAETGVIPPGSYELTVRARDHEPVSFGARELQADETLDLGEVRLGK